MKAVTTDPLDELIADLRQAPAAHGAGLLLVAARLRALEIMSDHSDVDLADVPKLAGAEIERVMWLLVDAGQRAISGRIVDRDAERQVRDALDAASALGYRR